MKKLLKSLPALFAVFTIVSLLLLSLSVSQTNADLKQLNSHIQQNTEQNELSQLDILETSLLDIFERIQALENTPIPPAPVSQAQLTSTQMQNRSEFERLQSRIKHLSGLLESLSQQKDDLDHFRQQLEQLEAKQEARQKPSDDIKASDRSSSVPASKPALAPSSSPFKVIGIEMRGQESLLAIRFNAPPHTIRLLRVGDAIDKWTLTTIQSHKAQFRVNNRIINLTIPN